MKNSEEKLSMNELTAQVFLFFLAGFETSSTTITMTLYELGRNCDIQNKVRRDILHVLEKYNGEATYDAVHEMKYLAQTIDETLRLWPPVATLTRVCVNDYTFENSDITVEKDTPILIPTLGVTQRPQILA
ncbi:hypothetical protein NQ318_015606 [Aromia moschata]|uniref:Cytochrome P450 n=1 Tax=Aromia moschata TaxID=1265417 RepID=A0AAV8XPQ0_9CUCU|nr:hypothetical protein NQ318_015606 [Aromia moschata]